MELEKIKHAYGALYSLENNLRKYIETTMTDEYGHGWWIQAPLSKKYPVYKKHFNNIYFHELISLLKAYECLATPFSSSLMVQLIGVIPIRNNIAHTKIITENDLQMLLDTDIKVKKILDFKKV